ncbi:MAG: hypothetical protein JWR21_7 [Herminiimonas sp.]|nr:hypothetical protein [Herminiimonas sp.]
MSVTNRTLRCVAIFVGMGTLIYTGAVVWFGLASFIRAATLIGPVAILIGGAATLIGYLVRFMRWHQLLKWLGHDLPAALNMRVYLAGLALTASPGKLGETIRSFLLLPRGVRAADSLAAFFADRLSDVIGVALLGAAGGWLAGRRETVLEALAIGLLSLSFLARAIVRSRCWEKGVMDARKWGRAGGCLAALASPASVFAGLWNLRRALLCATCGCVAYGIQGAVFADFADRVGATISSAECMAIFASATLIGAASMIPAGLGAMEAALVYQLMTFGVGAPDAIAVAIATRVSTLWCGLLVGSIALLSFAQAADSDRVTRRKPVDCR